MKGCGLFQKRTVLTRRSQRRRNLTLRKGIDILELRSHPRYDVECAISFKGDQVVGEGTLVNISLGGYKIVVSDQSVPNGTYLSLIVDIPGEDSRLEVELAVVRWSKGR